jgi:hypothetical protein
MGMNPNHPVRVVNNTSVEYTFRHNRQNYLLPADQTVFWPWEVACQLLGDPTLKNEPRADHASYVRLRSYKLLSKRQAMSIPPDWQPPDIETYDTSGERIHMAFESSVNAPTFSTGFTEDDMKVRIAQLESQITNMKQSMETAQVPFVVTDSSALEDDAPTSMDELPEDLPKKSAPSRKRLPPRIEVSE